MAGEGATVNLVRPHPDSEQTCGRRPVQHDRPTPDLLQVTAQPIGDPILLSRHDQNIGCQRHCSDEGRPRERRRPTSARGSRPAVRRRGGARPSGGWLFAVAAVVPTILDIVFILFLQMRYLALDLLIVFLVPSLMRCVIASLIFGGATAADIAAGFVTGGVAAARAASRERIRNGGPNR